jgi:3-methyladenine DNA glycosylase AlkD
MAAVMGAGGNQLDYSEIIAWLESRANAANVSGMARFGIRPAHAYGIPMKELQPFARKVGKDHGLANRLWMQGAHEARLLAVFVDDPVLVTQAQAEAWARDLDNWAICDSLCMHLLWRTPFAHEQAVLWSSREQEFVKRAGFALMAKLAWSDKRAPEDQIAAFLPIIRREAGDERPMVHKAVNWALRQIGKRSVGLHTLAVGTAQAILSDGSKSGRWVARDALRELEGAAVKRRLGSTG